MIHDKKQEPVTLSDLETWGGQLTLNFNKDIQQVETKLEEVFSHKLDAWGEKIIKHFDQNIEAWIENRAADLLGVKHDEIRLIQDKQKNHDARIGKIEERIGA